MLDGTLFFVKSARCGKPGKDASSVFFFFVIAVFSPRSTLSLTEFFFSFLVIVIQTAFREKDELFR